MKWHKFDPTKGSRQKRPPIRKWVLVLLVHEDKLYSEKIVVGYRKDHAMDKQAPFFVTPGAGQGCSSQGNGYRVIAWCDCLPDGFSWPLELESQ